MGLKTLEEVHKWFVLLSIANSSPCNAAPKSLKTKFRELLEEDLSNEGDSIGNQEHLYFAHKIISFK